MIVNDKWKLVQEFYSSKFSYPEDITDYLACRDIVKESCIGYSNTRIAGRRKFSIEYVISSIYKFLDVDGWDRDLKFSPLALYKNSSSLQEFINMVESYSVYDYLSSEEIGIESFFMCKKFLELEELLKGYDN